MYSLKTGALIHAAVVSASILCDKLSADQASAIDAFGRTIGVAFQIKDDILDVEGETHLIGKHTGADQRLGKATYPGLMGIDRARNRCDSLLHNALEQLDDFGATADSLRWLARFIVERGN
jgi:geranylgeranyl pyrophosphate synthase